MDLLPWGYYGADGTDPIMKQTDHQRMVGRWCEAVFEESKNELERHEEIVELDKHIKYLMGKQWTGRRPSWKPSPVANRMWTNLIMLVSFLTDIRQSFEARTNNKLYMDHEKILNKLIRAWFFSEDTDVTLAMIIIYAALTIGYGRLVWNDELKNGMGEQELTACSALDVIPIRPGHNMQRCLGVIYRTAKPLSWFREHYPISGFAVPPDMQLSRYTTQTAPSTAAGVPYSMLSPQMRRWVGGSLTEVHDSAIPMALYREFWLRDEQRNTSDRDIYIGNPGLEYGYRVRPGEKIYPRGRLIVMGGPVVLFDGCNPFWHGQFPFAALRLNRVPWQWLGISEFKNQIPLQDAMNSILAGIMEMVKKAVNPTFVAPENAFSAQVKKSIEPDMPGAKLFYSASAIQMPFYVPGPQLQPFVFQTMLYCQQELDSQSGFIDIGNISRKGIIPAADTLEQMKEGQQTLVRLKVRYIEAFLRDIGEQFIPNAFQFYTMERRLVTLGADGFTFEDFDFNPKSMIPAGISPETHWRQFQFMLMPGSTLKSSRVPQQALMLNLRRTGDMDRRNLFEQLDLGGMVDSVEKNLDLEGKQVFINFLRQKMAGEGGGGGLSPDQLQQLSQVTNATKGPAVVQ